MPVIAVTGFRASGKSTIISNLAAILGRDKLVACVPCDWRYASLARFFGEKITPEKSVGLISRDPDPSMVLTPVAHNNNIYVAGIADTENCFNHVPPETEQIEEFLARLPSVAHYVFIEAGEVQFNRLSYYALDKADMIINVLSPTVQGRAWHSATTGMIEAFIDEKQESGSETAETTEQEQKKEKTLISVLNADRNYMWPNMDEVTLSLPYDKHVAVSADKGIPVTMDNSVNCKKYLKAVKALGKLIVDGGVTA